MIPLDLTRTSWIGTPHAPADDPYTAWRNANNRCAHALRTWRAAAPRARAAAYRAYVAELLLEEAAARKLERLYALRAAT